MLGAIVDHGSPGPVRRAIRPFWIDLVTLIPKCPDVSGRPRLAFSIVWADMASGCTKLTLVQSSVADHGQACCGHGNATMHRVWGVTPDAFHYGRKHSADPVQVEG